MCVFVYLAQFACLEWSPCEERLLYVAEKKRAGPSASDSGSLGVLEEEVCRLAHILLSNCHNYVQLDDNLLLLIKS